MTLEEKQLLLKDLCARLPYGVLILDTAAEKYGKLYQINSDFVWYDCKETEDIECQTIFNVKPYLRPMESMTEEERKIYIEISSHLCGEIAAKTMIDWLNKNHFDYRGLIPMGLVLEAKEGMYKTE